MKTLLLGLLLLGMGCGDKQENELDPFLQYNPTPIPDQRMQRELTRVIAKFKEYNMRYYIPKHLRAYYLDDIARCDNKWVYGCTIPEGDMDDVLIVVTHIEGDCVYDDSLDHELIHALAFDEDDYGDHANPVLWIGIAASLAKQDFYTCHNLSEFAPGSK